jgi:hypothetical protein
MLDLFKKFSKILVLNFSTLLLENPINSKKINKNGCIFPDYGTRIFMCFSVYDRPGGR